MSIQTPGDQLQSIFEEMLKDVDGINRECEHGRGPEGKGGPCGNTAIWWIKLNCGHVVYMCSPCQTKLLQCARAMFCNPKCTGAWNSASEAIHSMGRL